MKWFLVCVGVCVGDPVFTEQFRTYNECMAAVFSYLMRHNRKLEVYCKQDVRKPNQQPEIFDDRSSATQASIAPKSITSE